jgi:CRP/FNR family transcriptional regulator, cyclic AMP receptor protein
MERSDIQRSLEECEFFKSLRPAQVESIAAICRMQRADAGEALYRQGELGEDLFIVVEGQVVLERAISVGARRGTVVVAMLGKGRIFGSWSTLLNEPHLLMLSAVCNKPALLVAFKGTELRRLMTADMQLGFGLLEKLCFLLRERLQLALGAIENL